MNSFADLQRAARRLAMLQLLAEAPAYETSAQLIYAALPSRGAAASADQIAVDLAWLAEQGLVESQIVGPVVMVKITLRGLDASKGFVQIPGVARPGP